MKIPRKVNTSSYIDITQKTVVLNGHLFFFLSF